MRKNSNKKTEFKELDRIAKLLVRRDFELMGMKEKYEKELREMDRIAKMLIKRDFELSEIREKREEELKELEKRNKEITGSRIALMNILEDVEKAKRGSEEERDKTLAIFDNFPEGLLFLDKEDRISSANPDIGDFFELDPGEIIGKRIDELKKSPLAPIIDVLIESSKGIYRKELKLRENLILEISAIPVMRVEEKIGTLIILRDITREKIIERLKTEFVSIAAHQLRTPLSAVKWTLKMILDGDLGEVLKEQREFLNKTYISNERMIRLINDLLNITRIEEGRFLYNVQKQSIIEVAEKVVASSREEAQRRGIHFEFKKPRKKIPEVKIDSEKISLVFQNILDNAIHYTKTGGHVKVSIDYLKDEEKMIISVKDTGIGILKEQQRRVFSRLLANEIVSVQPLALPSGLLFYMDARVSYAGSDTKFEATPPGITNGTGARDIVAPQNTANGQAGPVFADTTAYFLR